MKFVDLHNHTLWGVDDGPETPQQMFAMLDAAWADGVEAVCLTPHFHPGYFGNNGRQTDLAFGALVRYAAEKYPRMRLYLGNELRCSGDCLSWLESGECRTLNGTGRVLVDFAEDEPERNIVRGLGRLMNAGYRPVLAHAERYRELSLEQIRGLRQNGIRIQIDVQSFFGVYGLRARLRCRELLREKLADIASSDAHGLGRRNPVLSRGFRAIGKKYGQAYAGAIFSENPMRLLTEENRKGVMTDYE